VTADLANVGSALCLRCQRVKHGPIMQKSSAAEAGCQLPLGV